MQSPKLRGNILSKFMPSVVCAIQPEWIFLQRVTKFKGQAFAGVEKILPVTFLPRCRRSEYTVSEEI